MGRKRLPWIKLWLEFRTDPKMQRLSLAERGAFIGLLLLAAESPIRGQLMISETEPMTLKDIGKALNIQPYEYKILRSLITSCSKMGSLSVKDGAFVVTHFLERQDANPSDEIDYHKAKRRPIRTGLSPDSHLNDAGNQDSNLLESQIQSQIQSQRRDSTPLAPSPAAREETTGISPPGTALSVYREWVKRDVTRHTDVQELAYIDADYTQEQIVLAAKRLLDQPEYKRSVPYWRGILEGMRERNDWADTDKRQQRTFVPVRGQQPAAGSSGSATTPDADEWHPDDPEETLQKMREMRSRVPKP